MTGVTSMSLVGSPIVFFFEKSDRVIAWERSRAASGYGIIWRDADRNKESSAEFHSVVWF